MHAVVHAHRHQNTMKRRIRQLGHNQNTYHKPYKRRHRNAIRNHQEKPSINHYIYVYVYVYVHAYVYVYISIFIHKPTNIHIYTYTSAHAYTNTHPYACMHAIQQLSLQWSNIYIYTYREREREGLYQYAYFLTRNPNPTSNIVNSCLCD